MKLKEGDIVRFNPNMDYKQWRDNWKNIIPTLIKNNHMFIICQTKTGIYFIKNYDNTINLPLNIFSIGLQYISIYFLKVGEITTNEI